MPLPAAVSPSTRSCESAPSGQVSEAPAARPWLLAVLVVGCLIFNFVGLLFFKASVNAFGQKYVFFLAQVWCLSNDILVLAVIIVRWTASADYRRALRESTRKLHPCWLVVPALLDGLGSVLLSVGAPNVPGSWTVLLGQPQLFFVMVLSALCLGVSFNCRQIVGAILTVLGAVLAVLPRLIRSSGRGERLKVGYTLLCFSADIPAALSVVYKRWAFEKGDLDVFYLTAMVSWVQLPLEWIFLPLLSLPAFGGTRISSIGEVMADGAACLMGDTSIPVYDADGNTTGRCGGYMVTIVFLVASLCGFFAGICHLYVMKFGSASLFVLVGALAVPIGNFSFDLPFLTVPLGLPASAFSWTNFVGVLVVVAGFSLYTVRPPPKASCRHESSRLDVKRDMERSGLN